MLIEFRVENHRSLRDEQVLSMESGRGGDDSDHRPRKVPGTSKTVLPVAALYGGNASGKSNVLDAFQFMRDAVVTSHRYWGPEGGIPRNPFAWGPKRLEPSLFEAMFVLNGVRYRYGFTASDERFLEEWLHAWPNGKKISLYVRENDVFHFNSMLKGQNKLIEEVTRANALFLSAAVQFKHQDLQAIYAWFAGAHLLNLPVLRNRPSVLPRPEYLPAQLLGDDDGPSRLTNEASEGFLEQFRGFLKSADIGIADVRRRATGADEAARSIGRPIGFELKHYCETDDGWLPLEEESKGTRTLYHIAPFVLHVIHTGGILMIDELESSLHPNLAQEIVRQFNDPGTNPRNAQLVFTTHDTNLLGTTLGEPVVRRDEVWLTEKSPEGATVLYPLSDYQPRKSENLERGYLQGRFGAIPFLGNFSVTGESS